jgi:hypothetical protein
MPNKNIKDCTPLDFLSHSFSLNVNGKSTYKTKVGMFLSLSCLGSFVCLIYFNVSQYMDKSKPRVSQELQSMLNPPKIDFVIEKHFPIMFFYYEDSTPIASIDELEAFVHVVFILSYYKKDNDGNEQYYQIKLQSKMCSELAAQGKTETMEPSNDNFVKSNYLLSGICFDLDGKEITLGGATDGRYYETASVEVYPCKLGADCKPPSELAKISFAFANPTVNLNLKNYKNPLLYTTEAEDYYYITPGLGSKHKMYFMKAEIKDDNGYLSPTQQPATFSVIRNIQYLAFERNASKTTCTEEEIKSYKCDTYYRLVFSNTYSHLVITREYKGLIETFSEIGGMVELILIVTSAFYSIYHNEALRQYLVLQIYGLSKPKTPRRCFWMQKVQSIDPKKKEELQLYKEACDRLSKDLDITWILRELKALKMMLIKSGVQESGESEQELARQQLLASVGKNNAQMYSVDPAEDSRVIPLNSKTPPMNKILPLRITQGKNRQSLSGRKNKQQQSTGANPVPLANDRVKPSDFPAKHK